MKTLSKNTELKLYNIERLYNIIKDNPGKTIDELCLLHEYNKNSLWKFLMILLDKRKIIRVKDKSFWKYYDYSYKNKVQDNQDILENILLILKNNPGIDSKKLHKLYVKKYTKISLISLRKYILILIKQNKVERKKIIYKGIKYEYYLK